ncbi:MAG: 2-C-methyl-D-erythritol 4-phosphate cytidylyltransferase [Dehalococcoidia bacterium]
MLEQDTTPPVHPLAAPAEGAVVAIVLAAGSSSRMGGIDKIWAELGGAPLIAYALRAMAETPGVETVVAVAPAERHAAIAGLLDGWDVHVRCVEGGARRQDSVAAGIAAAPDAAWYLVHDGARALVTTGLAARVLSAARAYGAAIPGVPIADTVKRAQPIEGARDIEAVRGTVDRAPLRAVQTPQAFRGALLRRAHAEVSANVTDDAAMIEHLGEPVVLVPGDPTNLKVTTPADLAVARVLLAQREE